MGTKETERERWERENRRAYREAEHFGDQEELNRLDAEWNALDDDAPDGFDTWTAEQGLPRTIEVDGDEVPLRAFVALIEYDADDICCFKRVFCDSFDTRKQAVAAHEGWRSRFAAIGGTVIVVKRDEVGQVLGNGHVRLTSEGSVKPLAPRPANASRGLVE